jgi:hypothetical protein
MTGGRQCESTSPCTPPPIPAPPYLTVCAYKAVALLQPLRCADAYSGVSEVLTRLSLKSPGLGPSLPEPSPSLSIGLGFSFCEA